MHKPVTHLKINYNKLNYYLKFIDMNIFKILANGDGKINEPNISAFLGYLLDPYQDHGLGFEFLERFLEPFFENREEPFNLRSFDYKILFEQAFKDEDKEIKKKELVDIVILCFESNKGNYKELIAESIINNKPELKYIFLLENKVKPFKKEKQIKAQFENSIKMLKIDKSKVISIYVTPDNEEYEKEFEKFTENVLKQHYIWKRKDSNNKDDIFNLLIDLIKEESEGKIEAINEYTKHTLISFIKFIENNFKSQFVEELEGKNAKKTFFDFNDFKNSEEKILTKDSWEIITSFNNYINNNHKDFTKQHSPSHPISLFTDNFSTKFFSLSRNGKGLRIELVYSNHYNLKRNIESIKEEVKKLDFSITKETDRYIEIRNITDIKMVENLLNIHIKYL